MTTTKHANHAIARLGPRGRVTIPAEYRRRLSLSDDSAVAVVQVGDALVIAPCDPAFTEITSRLQSRMEALGLSVEELTEAANEARAQIVREEFKVDASE